VREAGRDPVRDACAGEIVATGQERCRDATRSVIELGVRVRTAVIDEGRAIAVRSDARDERRCQQDRQRWLFFEPSFSSSATVAGNGEMRWTGPFAMSAVVWPRRLTAVTSAPFSTR
jgi:hypothetical protein